MYRRVISCAMITFFLCAGFAARAAEGPTAFKQIIGQAPLGFVEVRGVAAGNFDPADWQAGVPNVLPDHRRPMMMPRWTGNFHNIYAPSIVKVGDEFRIFYGGWDGLEEGQDAIYSVMTREFLDFTDRKMIIRRNELDHVNNVNCLRLPTGEYRMMCTGLTGGHYGLNKPVVFNSPDGELWNGSPVPYAAFKSDRIEIDNYPYEGADINGMNVLYYEDGRYYVYHNDFKDLGKVFRAVGTDGKHFTSEGPVLETPCLVNDVKMFEVDGKRWYLMGLHINGFDLFYSVSDDGAHFPPMQFLRHYSDDAEKYMTSMGWVVDGDRLLGYLYGAGADVGICSNRIFASWVQKKVVFVAEDGRRFEGTQAIGPDRQLIPAPLEGEMLGFFEIYDEDGITRLPGRFPAGEHPAHFRSGSVFVFE